MELQHFRHFVVVAEERSFRRAAQRLNVKQSLLVREIRDLEGELCVLLFKRKGSTLSLTVLGDVFLKYLSKVSKGLHNYSIKTLSVALSDTVSVTQLRTILECWKKDHQEVDVQCLDVSFSSQCSGLYYGLYDVGFSHSSTARSGVLSTEVYCEPLKVLLPNRHPLLAYDRIPLKELLSHQLMMCDSGYAQQLSEWSYSVKYDYHDDPLIIESVKSFDVMIKLVLAGLALGVASDSQTALIQDPGIVTRFLAEDSFMLTTYLHCSVGELPEVVESFIKCVNVVGLNTS